MADFGWAFVKGNLVTGSAPPSGAVQFNDGNNKLAASGDLVFISGSTSQLNLTGALNVSGTINANRLNITVTEQNVVNISSTGSTKFGDTTDDLHQFTGSLNVAGNMSASANISASAFYGDGSNLTNITTNPAGANTQIQFNNSNNFGASSNLTFASNTLAVNGDISASINVSASAFYGDGSNLSGITTSPAGSDKQIQFNNSNNFGASSNLVFDNGKLGVGTSNPDAQPDEKDDLVIGDHTGNRGMTIASTNTGIGTIRFAPNTSANDIEGWIDYSGNTKKMRFGTNGLNTRVTIDGTGKVGIAEGSPDHMLTVAGDISASVNVSASAFYGDGSNLTGIATTLDAVTNNGNTTSNAMTASALNLTGLSAGTALNTKFLALDSDNNVILTSSNGGNSTMIGAAEDGTYADGLFSDFTTSTLIGTAIDKFNEILKIIVPGPAPAVDRINYTNVNGISTKLSFQTQPQAPSGYIDVGSSGSFTSPPNIDEQYTVATSGEDFRLGVYNGSQEITGVVNFHVVEELKTSEVNYSHNAFGNAESGSLKLFLNGSEIHSLNLTASGAGNPNSGSASDLNSSGSGFFAISITSSATDQNGSKYNIFQHRTAKYVVDPQDQVKGWNYAQVMHQFGATTYATNFVQWFNDTDASSNAMAVSNARVTFTGNGSKYLSGVQYFRSASLVYNADVSNVYKFTYPTGNVLTFNRSSNIGAITAQSLPATDGTDLFNKVLRITSSQTDTNEDTMLNSSTTISIDLEHPLKTNLSATGSITTSGILIYNVDTSNTNLDENFDLENFRITNGSYASQNSVTDSSATWNSQNHMTGGGATGHTDGLIMYNGRLRSPREGANSGNFSTLANGPAGNPNYSGVTGTKTFFRKIQNTSGGDIRDLKITSTKSSRYNNSSLTTNNAKFSIKIPESSAWLDISQPFTYGAISVDGNGALISGANDNSNTGATDSGTSRHCVTFGTASVANNKYVVIKIEADGELWTGNINRLQFQLGASDDDDAVTPDTVADLNLDDTAGVDAKLSFGTSNDVSGYTNVTGGLGSMPPVNSNALYSDNSDTRRGVFSAFEVMGGTINPTASTLRDGTEDTFHNGFTGSLVLEVNGTEYGAINLAASRNASSSISSNTGLSVSAVGESETSDGIPDFRLHYRTGTYSVGTGQQRLGWNYARVIHRVGGVDTTTNYTQWVVDTSASTDTAISTPTLTNFGHSSVYYQSGIGYFATNPTASFSFSGSNFYNNVYQNGNAIDFPTIASASINTITGSGTGLTTLTTTSTTMAMPALDNSPDCETTEIVVTSSLTYNGGTSISGGLGLFTARNSGLQGRIIHPLKSPRTTTLAEKTGFMRFSGSLGSTNLNTNEYFGFETYRIVSGNYANQAAVTSSSNTWNSQTHMNAANAHGDGMVTIDNKAISPLKIGKAGDTRNVAESGVLQAPNGNPDYSTLSEDIRTYYRYFRNQTGQAKPTFTLTLYGDANLVAKSGDFYTGTLSSNKNINVELKVPTDPAFTGLDDTSTAWADCIKPFSAGTQPNVDGVGIFNGGGSDLNQTVGTGGRAIALQLQEKQVRNDQYFVVKISAHKDWTGYLSRIEITY